jgi:hypothetical protein
MRRNPRKNKKKTKKTPTHHLQRSVGFLLTDCCFLFFFLRLNKRKTHINLIHLNLLFFFFAAMSATPPAKSGNVWHASDEPAVAIVTETTDEDSLLDSRTIYKFCVSLRIVTVCVLFFSLSLQVRADLSEARPCAKIDSKRRCMSLSRTFRSHLLVARSPIFVSRTFFFVPTFFFFFFAHSMQRNTMRFDAAV